MLVTAYACDMSNTGNSRQSGSGFTHAEYFYSEGDRGTFAQYFGSAQDLIGSNHRTPCGGSSQLLNYQEINHTYMVKTQTLNHADYSYMDSGVIGDGDAISIWKE